MLVITTALILLKATAVSADRKLFETLEPENVVRLCEGKYKDKELSPDALTAVLNDHKRWIQTYIINKSKPILPDTRKTDLCMAHLTGADLRGALLSYADLSGARLSGANLSNAQMYRTNLNKAITSLDESKLKSTDWIGHVLRKTDLSGADLTDANLSEANIGNANLSGADISDANLSEAYLFNADLSEAKLFRANLNSAVLREANLSGADLTEANLSGADLSRADLSRVIFQPKDLPDVDKIAYSVNLAKMVFDNNPQQLVKLREMLKDAGYQEQRKAITYALKHTAMLKMLREIRNSALIPVLEGIFQYVFFNFTTRWGMAPSRALLILLVLIPLFTIPYSIALQHRGVDGIWLKWSDDRMASRAWN